MFIEDEVSLTPGPWGREKSLGCAGNQGAIPLSPRP
jgi:hypothetical protein